MDENILVRLKLIGFNQADSNNLSAILTLATRALKKKWQIVDTVQADFFLVSVESSVSESKDSILKKFPAERCLFCSTAAEFHPEYTLLVDEKHLPRLSVLVKLFNQLTENPASGAEINSPDLDNQALPAPVIDTEVTVEPFFDAQKGLLGHLLATEHEQLMIRLSDHLDYPALFIDVTKNTYYSQNNLEQLNAYLIRPEKLTLKSCAKMELEQLIAFKHLQPKPLKDLIWYIAIKTSAGKVIKNHADNDIVSLKKWPDLKLFQCMAYAKLATFMKHNAAPLETIAEYTKMPLAEVNNFYNACYLLGLIEKRNQIEITKKNLSSEHMDLLSKIDARLK